MSIFFAAAAFPLFHFSCIHRNRERPEALKLGRLVRFDSLGWSVGRSASALLADGKKGIGKKLLLLLLVWHESIKCYLHIKYFFPQPFPPFSTPASKPSG